MGNTNHELDINIKHEPIELMLGRRRERLFEKLATVLASTVLNYKLDTRDGKETLN